jgi:hypothetical protein
MHLNGTSPACVFITQQITYRYVRCTQHSGTLQAHLLDMRSYASSCDDVSLPSSTVGLGAPSSPRTTQCAAVSTTLQPHTVSRCSGMQQPLFQLLMLHACLVCVCSCPTYSVVFEYYQAVPCLQAATQDIFPPMAHHLEV